MLCGASAGVLPMALAAREAGIRTLYVPADNAAEATLAEGLTVYGVPDVGALVAHLKNEAPSLPRPGLGTGAGGNRPAGLAGRDGTGAREAGTGDRRGRWT